MFDQRSLSKDSYNRQGQKVQSNRGNSNGTNNNAGGRKSQLSALSGLSGNVPNSGTEANQKAGSSGLTIHQKYSNQPGKSGRAGVSAK